MQGLSKRHTLEVLRTRIEGIEKQAPLARALQRIEGDALSELPPGVLHEVFADSSRNAGASFGFALAVSRQLLTPERPAILVVQLAGEAQNLGIPYGLGIRSFGIDPANIVLCRPETSVELLWAVEEAIGCRAVAAVIADVGSKMKSLDFTASRRLSLRTASGGSSVFLLRYGTERNVSAARFRWRIEPAVSGEKAFDARAPGKTRWRVELEKGQLGSKRRDPMDWVLDWMEDGFVLAKSQTRSTAFPAGDKALPRVEPATLGDRLSKAG